MSQLNEELLSRIDIVDVVSKYVQLKRVGRNFVGLSPFRNERTPSFTVSPDKQIFKCFSTGIWGNVIKFMMEIEKMDYRDAAKHLAEDFHIDITKYQNKTYNPAQYQGIKDDREKFKLMNTLVVNFFSEHFKKNTQALHYMKEVRKLDDQMLQEFQIGYAPDNLYELSTFLTSKGFTAQDGIEAWLLKKSSQWEMYAFFRNRIIFPVYDHMWNVVGFGARALRAEDTPKYLNSTDTLLYEKSKILYGFHKAKNALKELESFIVVEGYMDVIALARAGMGNGIATCGTALTFEHIKMIKRYTQNMYFLFDNDKAWFDATIRALSLCYQQDIYPKNLSIPSQYKDIDEYVNSGVFSKESFLLTQQDAYQAVCERLLSQYDLKSAVDKQIIVNKMFELLIYIGNVAIQDHYLHYLAAKIEMYYEILFQQFKVFVRNQSKFLSSKKSFEEAIDHLTKDQIIASLFFHNAIQEYLPSSYSVFQEIYDFLTSLHVVLGDEVLYQEQRLLEAQLWWEQELATFTSEEQKNQFIQKIFLDYLNEEFKKIHKYPLISPDHKNKLLYYRSLLIKSKK